MSTPSTPSKGTSTTAGGASPDPKDVADQIERFGAAVLAQPGIRQAAATIPKLLSKAIRQFRTPAGALPASQLTESPLRYAERAAAGDVGYFDRYNKQRVTEIEEGTTMTPVGSTAQNAAVGDAVGDPPAVKVLDAKGAPMAGVLVRFVVVAALGRLQSEAEVTDAKGTAGVGRWTLNSAGKHLVQAQAGRLCVDFEATAP